MNAFSTLFGPKDDSKNLPHLHNNTPNFTPPLARPKPGAIQLDIVTGSRCPICQASLPLVEQFRADMPGVVIRVIDIDVPGTVVPPNIVAIPTFLINGYIVATGNPDVDELKQFIATLTN